MLRCPGLPSSPFSAPRADPQGHWPQSTTQACVACGSRSSSDGLQKVFVCDSTLQFLGKHNFKSCCCQNSGLYHRWDTVHYQLNCNTNVLINRISVDWLNTSLFPAYIKPNGSSSRGWGGGEKDLLHVVILGHKMLWLLIHGASTSAS